MLTSLLAIGALSMSMSLTLQDATPPASEPSGTAPSASTVPETPADATSAAPAAPVLQLGQVEPRNPTLVERSAGEYAAYHGVIADLHSAPIASSQDLDTAMNRLTAFYGEERLVRAWIAYAAIIAARHPEYLDEVRELADYYGPEAAMTGLMYDPTYATSFASSEDAQASVVDAMAADNAEIREVSERYRAAAYDLQSERWANRSYGDRSDRLAELSVMGSQPINMTDEVLMTLSGGFDNGLPASALFEHMDAAPLSDRASVAPQLTLTVGEAVPDPDRSRIGRILSVAALQSLNNGDPARTDQVVDALLADPVVERCLAWVRLDLQQCVAAGHFMYEDSFCIAEHALMDVSRCLGSSAN
ncbi:hypothetical protein [Maricaulis maris]|uniref:Uncharacterized protein n=1 Tax=Maricaulis maris TaxID=74318 RepID=A0A495D135_9PROT|nr:hypothetical protein [Maricaulis maris]RKQ95218.1 hypothetical protein C7435_2907 [Maricaulis maris]